MKYFVLLFAIAAWGSLGLIIGKGVAGTWREESNADKKARISNDPDIQTCTHDSEKRKKHRKLENAIKSPSGVFQTDFFQ